MVRRIKQTLQKHLRPVGYVRWSRMFMALLMLVSSLLPTLMWIHDAKAYALSPEVEKVIGSANSNLSAKFSFDKENNRWQFNKNGVASLANTLAKQQGSKDAEGIAGALGQLAAQQVGGGGKKDTSLYSVDLPVKAKDGITYYDNVTRLSFKMIPTFSARDGKLSEGRVVYPFMGNGKVVYTAKTNGLKEDIVLSDYSGDTLRYSYELDLPETLEARLLDDGSIGIYSANPALFGDISFGGDTDKDKILEARKLGTKDNLVFGIPAPFIKDQSGQAGHTRYELNGKQLSVVAEGLKGLKYPLTVDPSVEITSSSAFEADSNNESNIQFGAGADDIKRGASSGGTTGSWVARTVPPAVGTCSVGTSNHGSGINNGYYYVMGQNCIMWAKLNSDGTINGTWTTTTGFTRTGYSGFVYSGYIYLIGGDNGASNNTTAYAKLNANGSIGAFTAGSNITTTYIQLRTVAYNGYAYALGGTNGALAYTDVVQKAAINANGSLGTWTTTTPMPGAQAQQMVSVYNGFMYVAGGDSGVGDAAYYAPIASNGDVGTWVAASSLPGGAVSAVRLASSVIYKGYWYILGGVNNGTTNMGTVVYAPINANGSVGSWSVTDALPSVGHTVAEVYNDYLFAFTVHNGTTNAIASASIDSAGSIGVFAATADFDTAGGNERYAMATVVSHGYMYLLGGNLATGGQTNTVRSARICDGIITTGGCSAGAANAGTIGTWTANTSFTDARNLATAVAHGDSIYLAGGQRSGAGTVGCTDVQGGVVYCQEVLKATVDPNTGTLGTWTSYTYSALGRASVGAVVVNDYLYIIGGRYNSNASETTEVNYAKINADGTLQSFGTTQPMLVGRSLDAGAVAWGGSIYVVGGNNRITTEYATPAADGTIPVSGAGTWAYTAGDLPVGGGGIGPWHSETVIYNGYIYVSGGQVNNNNGTTVTYIARINANGTITGWTTSDQAFPVGRYGHGSVAHNGYLYIIGGCTNTLGCTSFYNSVRKDVQYTRINNGGNGVAGAWASGSTSASIARYAPMSVVSGGYMIIMGGCSTALLGNCTAIASSSTYATVNADGSLGAWTAGTALPQNLDASGVTVANGYVYLVGGCGSGGCSSVQSTVYSALICTGSNNGVDGCGATGGTLGTWHTLNPLSTARWATAAVAAEGYLYVSGGIDSGGTVLNDVKSAQILPNGGLGGWGSVGSGATLSTPIAGHGFVNYGGYLYVLGGIDSSTTYTDVRVAQLQANGQLGAWSATTSMPAKGAMSFAGAANGYMYMHGTLAGGVPTNRLMHAPIASNGALGQWSISSGNGGTALAGAAGGIYKGYIYRAGGFDGNSSLSSNSYYAPLEVQPRIGRYSKLLTISPTTEIASVYYNGTLGSGSSVSYKVAPISGVFGSVAAASQGTGSEPTPLCGLGSIYYVQIMTTLDDSTRAVFPDDGAGNMTDVTIYYRLNATSPPNLRLTGGKWFYSQTLQPLDICKA